MYSNSGCLKKVLFWSTMSLLITVFSTVGAFGRDLDEIKRQGVIRHLGVPYANFVTGSGDGMDVEIAQLFAKHIGVRYEYVKTSWESVVPDLVGKTVKPKGDDVEILTDSPVKGDMVANGFTVLPWREKILNFSTPTFPTQIILVAQAASTLKPIKPSGDVAKDIEQVKKLTKNRTVLGVENTCLDPALYNLSEAGAKVKNFTGAIDDLASAVVKGEAETSIMEMPDALLALKKYSGKIKIIGPLSPVQEMAAGFAKDASQLLAEFNKFLVQCKKDGTYRQLVKKYYPSAISFYATFFN
jgi:ABC-type amino acid transport substrate-binding protein